MASICGLAVIGPCLLKPHCIAMDGDGDQNPAHNGCTLTTAWYSQRIQVGRYLRVTCIFKWLIRHVAIPSHDNSHDIA
jgi:hypothetical protein